MAPFKPLPFRYSGAVWFRFGLLSWSVNYDHKFSAFPVMCCCCSLVFHTCRLNSLMVPDNLWLPSKEPVSLTLVAEACLSCPPAQLSSTLIAQRLSSSEDGRNVFVLLCFNLLQSICFILFPCTWAVSVALREGGRGYGFQICRGFSGLQALEPGRLSFLSCSIQKTFNSMTDLEKLKSG